MNKACHSRAPIATPMSKILKIVGVVIALAVVVPVLIFALQMLVILIDPPGR